LCAALHCITKCTSLIPRRTPTTAWDPDIPPSPSRSFSLPAAWSVCLSGAAPTRRDSCTSVSSHLFLPLISSEPATCNYPPAQSLPVSLSRCPPPAASESHQSRVGLARSTQAGRSSQRLLETPVRSESQQAPQPRPTSLSSFFFFRTMGSNEKLLCSVSPGS